MLELPFLHLGIQNIAGTSAFTLSHAGKLAAFFPFLLSICFSATDSYPGKRDVFVATFFQRP